MRIGRSIISLVGDTMKHPSSSKYDYSEYDQYFEKPKDYSPLKLFMVLIYNLCLLAGTAYLVQVHSWNPWWFLFAAVSMAGQSLLVPYKKDKDE